MELAVIRATETTVEFDNYGFGYDKITSFNRTYLQCTANWNDLFSLLVKYPKNNSQDFPINVWHHTACVISLNDSRAQMDVYINGTLIDGTHVIIPAGSTFEGDSSNLIIGAEPYDYFPGVRTNSANSTLDDLSFWSRALSEQEIQYIMSNSITAPPALTITPYKSSGDPLPQNASGVYTMQFLEGLYFKLSIKNPSADDSNVNLTCETTGGNLGVLAKPGSFINQNASVSMLGQTFLWVPIPIDVGVVVVSCCSSYSGTVPVYLGTDFTINITASPPMYITTADTVYSFTVLDGSPFFSISINVTGFPTPRIQWQRYQPGSGSSDSGSSSNPPSSAESNITASTSSSSSAQSNITASTPPSSAQSSITASTPSTLKKRDLVSDGYVDVPGATQQTLIIPNIDSSYDGARFRARITDPSTSRVNYTNDYTLSVASNEKSKDKTGTIIGAVVGSVVGCCCLCLIGLLVVAIILLILRRKNRNRYVRGPEIEKPETWNDVLYTNIDNRNLKSKAKGYADLEELLVHNPTNTSSGDAGSSSGGKSDGTKPILSTAIMRAVEVNVGGEMARRLLFILEDHDRAVDLVKSLVTEELDDVNAGDNTIFRQNSASMKTFSFYSKLIGLDYLWETLAAPVNELNWRAKGDAEEQGDSNDKTTSGNTTALFDFSMEVDPSKMGDASDSTINTLELWLIAQKMLKTIVKSSDQVPLPICNIMAHTYETMSQTERDGKNPFTEKTMFITMGNFFWLRYVCPAIMSPQSVGILNEVAHPTAQRQLILLSKVLQNLANDTLPGVKEAYMEKLNEFISSNRGLLQGFYDKLIQKGKSTNGKDGGVEVKSDAKNSSLYYVHEWLSGHMKDLSKTIPDDDDGAAVNAKLKEIMAELGTVGKSAK